MELVLVAHRCGTTFKIADVGAFVANDERALELSRVAGIDAEIGGEFHWAAGVLWYIHKRTIAEHGGIEGSEIVVTIRNHLPKILAHQVGMVLHRLADGAENDAFLGELFLESRLHRHGIHHSIHSRATQGKTLFERNAQFVESLHQFGVDFLALCIVLLLRRIGIVGNRLIVDVGQTKMSPCGLCLCLPIAESL